jgi:hypothetical protein
MPTPFEQGKHAAFTQLGLIKVAIPIPTGAVAPGLLSRIGGGLSRFGGAVKRTLIGEPGKFVGELAKGKAFSSGGMMHHGIRDAFSARNPLSLALNYGLPAYSLYGIMKSDSPDKPGQLGGFVGSTLGGAALSRPFGLVGGIAGSLIGHRLGAGAVHAGQRLTGTVPPEPQQPDAAAMVRQHMQQAYNQQNPGNYGQPAVY